MTFGTFAEELTQQELEKRELLGELIMLESESCIAF